MHVCELWLSFVVGIVLNSDACSALHQKISQGADVESVTHVALRVYVEQRAK